MVRSASDQKSDMNRPYRCRAEARRYRSKWQRQLRVLDCGRGRGAAAIERVLAAQVGHES